MVFNQNMSVDLGVDVASLRVSGSYTGLGSAKLYLSGKLVLDTALVNSSFENVCVDSCDSTDATDTLNIVVEGDAMLAITVFNYTEQNATQVN